ncbi:leucine zipper domain-containing protein [Enterobacter intestinihominis]
MSRKTGYKWLQRFDPSDLSSLSDRSRAPHSHSRTVPDLSLINISEPTRMIATSGFPSYA